LPEIARCCALGGVKVVSGFSGIVLPPSGDENIEPSDLPQSGCVRKLL
jgi:hypothetical protein